MHHSNVLIHRILNFGVCYVAFTVSKMTGEIMFVEELLSG